MPRFDGNGPLGYGPMTGRGMGPCAGGVGYPCRFGGYGRGFGRFRNNTDYVKALEEEIELIKEEISAVEGDQK